MRPYHLPLFPTPYSLLPIMNEIPSFTDANGEKWIIDIKTRDAERVKKWVSNPDGTPVDLTAYVEEGRLSAIVYSRETIIKIGFFLIYDQIMERFDLQEYNKQQEKYVEFEPELANRSIMQKAMDWFTARINGETVREMIQAYEVALLNFIRNADVREAFQDVIQKRNEFVKVSVDSAKKELLKTIDEQVPAGLGD